MLELLERVVFFIIFLCDVFSYIAIIKGLSMVLCIVVSGEYVLYRCVYVVLSILIVCVVLFVVCIVLLLINFIIVLTVFISAVAFSLSFSSNVIWLSSICVVSFVSEI